MRKTFLLSVIVPIALSSSLAQEIITATGSPRDDATNAIRENEKKFYEMNLEEGTRTAFLHYLADDGIIFRPGPVNGKEVWNKRPEGGISLAWKPKFIWVSRSADLGYSTGPAEWRKAKEDPQPFGYGQFITVWKKQKDGEWRVALDVGSEVPGPPNESEEDSHAEPYPPDNKDVAAINQSAAQKTLRETESKFTTAAKADSTVALIETSLPSLRVHREGGYPALGRIPAQLMLSVHRGHLTLERLGGGMSEACDLAYSYGKYSLGEAQKTERGHYLQVWRTDNDGTWKIALDFQVPLPDEPKK